MSELEKFKEELKQDVKMNTLLNTLNEIKEEQTPKISKQEIIDTENKAERQRLIRENMHLFE